MIFDSAINESAMNMSAVQESPYPLGLEGALMHVYETECNYNSLMKAVGLSELKYFKETGGDLFVQEAGAFSSFIAKAKALFQKVIDKIKQIGKKFLAVINSYILDDQTFVKKYKAELIRKKSDLKDMEFKGWKFGPAPTINTDATIDTLAKSTESAASDYAYDSFDNSDESAIDKANEDREEECNKLRAKLIGESGELTESEFRDKVRELLYGDGKEDLSGADIDISAAIATIEGSKKEIKDINDAQKKIIAAIDKYIKALTKVETDLAKLDRNDSEEVGKKKNVAGKAVSYEIALAKSFSNDMTVLFGLMVQQAKDKNRQAKAICVKALGYKKKNESASVFDSSNPFANVSIL